MRFHIILSDLDKCLFPEVYPYYNQYFQDDIDYLRKHYAYDETSLLNIAFKVKVVKYSCTVTDANLRYIMNSFFNKHIENYFDWHKKYDWHELKSILMFFLVFSAIRNERELEGLINNEHLKELFTKYLPKIIDVKTQ